MADPDAAHANGDRGQRERLMAYLAREDAERRRQRQLAVAGVADAATYEAGRRGLMPARRVPREVLEGTRGGKYNVGTLRSD